MNPMPATFLNESALKQGIKNVGIGKKGSRSLSRTQAQEILKELQNGEFTPASRGAFYTALFIKGLTPEEEVLAEHFPPGTLNDAGKLAQILCADAPPLIEHLCCHLLANKELSASQATDLGAFLFSDEKGDGARGVAAMALRVRYETIDEYISLLDVLKKTIRPEFRQPAPAGHPIIQFSEPFDGVDHNYLITPCVTHLLHNSGWRIVSMVGRNSGPKCGINLYDLAKTMDLCFLKQNAELTHEKTVGGYFIDQKMISPPLDRWVDYRHQIVKRPFLATLEKFLNPCYADILVTSAFHGGYGDKMAALAERAGFPASMVVRNGVEGTIAFPLTRPAKLLCSVRLSDGSYLRKDFVFDAGEFFGLPLPTEEKLNNPSLKINAQLVYDFIHYGKTNFIEFDRRIAWSCAGLNQGLDWILQKQKGEQNDLG